MPFLVVTLVALAVWLASEVPLFRELRRRFREAPGDPGTVPVLLVLCAVLDIAALVGGTLWLVLGNFSPPIDLDWRTACLALVWSFTPIGALGCVVAIGLSILSFFGCGGIPLPGLVLPVSILLLLSPFLRSGLLRRSPTRHPALLAAFALFTAYIPLIPFFAAFAFSDFFIP